MSESESPGWFSWFRDFGEYVSLIPTCGIQESALRFLISAPNTDFVGFALTAGSLSASKSPSRALDFGNRAVSWDNGRMCDAVFMQGSGKAWARFGNVGIAHGHTRPMAFVPDSAPEGRSPRKVSEDDKEFLRQAWGSTAWYMKYAEKCILPATLLGPRMELIGQLKELMTYCSEWFTEEEFALFQEDSYQVTNPNKFGMFPFMILNQGVAGPRPWLRQMESRIVIASSWSSYRGASRHFQQGVPRVILTDRRTSGASDAHAYVDELIKSGIKSIEPDFRKPPNGVHIFGFTERVVIDPGNEEITEDYEEFEL